MVFFWIGSFGFYWIWTFGFFGLGLSVFLWIGSFGFSGIGCYPLTEQIWQRLVGYGNLFDKGQPGSDKGQIYPMKESRREFRKRIDKEVIGKQEVIDLISY